MKLVKITEDLYLNSDLIVSVGTDGEGSTGIEMTNGEVFSPNVPIKKVLDAIGGSEEHLEIEDLQKQIYALQSKVAISNARK